MFNFEYELKMELEALRERIAKGYTMQECADEMEDKERLAVLEEEAIQYGME